MRRLPHLAIVLGLPVLILALAFVFQTSHDHRQHHHHTAIASTIDCGAGTITGSSYLNTFDGTPSSPANCEPSDAEVTKHSRNNWYSPTDWSPQHGTDCAGYPAVHAITEWDDTMFHCNGHIMTASNEGGFGETGFTVGFEADWSSTTTVIQWNLSTQPMSGRDWWVVTIDPLLVGGAQNYLQIPADEADVDLTGLPLEALRIKLQPSIADNLVGKFSIATSRAGVVVGVNPNPFKKHPSTLTPSNITRSLYQLELTDTVVGGVNKTHVKFFLPVQVGVTSEWVWMDHDIDRLAFSTGMVQMGHYSYTPTKSCTPTSGAPGCWPATWHWDNISISNGSAVGITSITRDTVDSTNAIQSLPHTNGGVVRLTCRSSTQALQYSTDAGATWVNLPVVPGSYNVNAYGAGMARMFAFPVASGVSAVRFRTTGGSTAWACRNLHLWSA